MASAEFVPSSFDPSKKYLAVTTGGKAVFSVIVIVLVASAVLSSWAFARTYLNKDNGTQDPSGSSVTARLSNLESHLVWGSTGSGCDYVALVTDSGAVLRYVDSSLCWTGSFEFYDLNTFGPMLQMGGATTGPYSKFQQTADNYEFYAPNAVLPEGERYANMRVKFTYEDGADPRGPPSNVQYIFSGEDTTITLDNVFGGPTAYYQEGYFGQ